MNKYKIGLALLITVLSIVIVGKSKYDNKNQLIIPLKNDKNDSCRTAVDKYACYGKQMQTILKTKGVDASIQYIKSVVMVSNGYSVSHVLFHAVGETAYYKQDRDIKRTVAYLKPYLASIDTQDEHLNGFDGFYHGAISTYFEDRLHEVPLPKLISNICSDSFEIPGISSNSFECYHTIGHGTMHALGNKLNDSIKICAELDNAVAQEGCYYGVFMEESFLFSPLYHKGMERPDVKGNSLIAVCNSFSGVQSASCSHFAGQVYLTTHPSDIKGAFDECKKLTNSVPSCIVRLGVVFIPSHHYGDYEKMKQICGYAGEIYKSTCIDAVNQGVRMGFGGPIKNFGSEKAH